MPKKFSIYTVIMAILIILALALLMRNNLDYAGIWYDELASFWISQGLNNFSPVHAHARGLSHVIRNNQSSNLDPGGHIILLHFWTKFRKDISWLRLFSFIFFLLGIAGIGLLAMEWTHSTLFGLFAIALTFAFNPILYYAFEIRAYSMEVAGIFWGTFTLSRVFLKPELKRFFLLGLVCTFFMWSRYTYSIFVGSLCCCVLAFILKQPRKERKKIILYSVFFFVPVLLCGLLIYHLSLRAQLAFGMGRGYMSKWMIQGKSLGQILYFLKINFLSLTALPITAALAFSFVIRPLLTNRFFTKNRIPSGSPDFTLFYWLILICQVFSFLLSALGFTPWYIGKFWSLYLVALSIIAIILLISELICFFRAHERFFETSSFLSPAIMISQLILVTGLCLHAAFYRHIYLVDLTGTLNYLEKQNLPQSSVFVTGYQIPTVRYMYEYGPYLGSSQYPKIFRFMKPSEWDTVAYSAKEDILFFLTGMSVEKISQIQGTKMQKIEGVNYLLKVIPQEPRQE